MSDEQLTAEQAIAALHAEPEPEPEPEPETETSEEVSPGEVPPEVQLQGPGQPILAYGSVYLPLKVGFEFEALTMDMQLVHREDGVCCVMLTAYTANGVNAMWLTPDMAEKLSTGLHNNAVTAKLRSGTPPSQLIVPGQPNRAQRRGRRNRPR